MNQGSGASSANAHPLVPRIGAVDFSNYWRQGQNWDTGLPFLNGQKKPVLIATDQQQGTAKTGAPQRRRSRKGVPTRITICWGAGQERERRLAPRATSSMKFLLKSWRCSWLLAPRLRLIPRWSDPCGPAVPTTRVGADWPRERARAFLQLRSPLFAPQLGFPAPALFHRQSLHEGYRIQRGWNRVHVRQAVLIGGRL